MRAHRSPLRVALFVVYLVLLAWVVLWKLAVPWVGAAAFLPHPIKWVPFLPSGDADGSAPLEVLANVLLFIPFGLHLALLAPRWRWWMSTAVFAASSLLLEVIQHLLSIGTADVTDLITNTAGGLAGLGIAAVLRRRLGDRATHVLTRVLVILTALAIVAVAAYLASPIRFAAPHDVIA